MVPSIADEQEQTGSQGGSLSGNREAWLVVAGLTILFVLAMVAGNRRYVWFDELFTFDIARSVSLQQLWFRLTRFDCNPPGAYLLSRLSMTVFGATPLGLRFPSMVEFYIGSMATLVYVRRKANIAFGALAVLLLWTVAPTLYYAVEARPYALLFASFACLLLAWDTAIRAAARRLALLAVAVSILAMALAHVFSVFTVLAFLVAEAVRWRREKRPDYPLWAATLLPMLAMLLYIPLVRFYGGIVFPIHASFESLRTFYEDLLGSPLIAFVLLTMVLLIPLAQTAGHAVRRKVEPEERALLCCMCLIPVLLTVVLMHRHGTFYPRYCTTSQVAILIALTLLLAHRFGLGRVPAYTAAALLAAFMLKMQIVRPLRYPAPKNAAFLASIDPQLPIVVGEGKQFFEMNHYESPALLGRVYFLKDREAALKYANSNFFHDLDAPDTMRDAGFPIAGHVDSYKDFIHQHHRFLLLGDSAEWVFLKLRPDGASIAIVDNYFGSMPYSDTTLYLVTMPTQ